MHIRVLFQDYNWTVPEIRKKYPTIPTTTIRYHAKLNAVDETGDRRKSNPGRPRILKVHDIRQLSRKVKQLRTFDDANFSAVKLRNLCGLPPCSMRTVHRAMRRDLNLRFLNTRQKGILSDADRKLRVAFCKDCVRRVGDKLWLEKMSFYYDGVSFYHKSNPFAEAVTTKAKIWRKPNEGLSMTRKGKKEGNNGKKVFMFVAVAYGKGVVMCEQFDPEIKFNGKNYKEFVAKHFPNTLRKSANPRSKVVLQDGDPVQKSAQAHIAYKRIGCSIFSIPARSPDLNPIENVFHETRHELTEEAKAKRITRESYKAYAARVKAAICATSPDLIDRTIESLPKRMKAVIASRGDRTKY